MPSKPTGWFHLTFVYHGPGNDVDIYCNGEWKRTVRAIIAPTSSGSGHMVIGRHVNKDANCRNRRADILEQLSFSDKDKMLKRWSFS